jgi:hypothetical protein
MQTINKLFSLKLLQCKWSENFFSLKLLQCKRSMNFFFTKTTSMYIHPYFISFPFIWVRLKLNRFNLKRKTLQVQRVCEQLELEHDFHFFPRAFNFHFLLSRHSGKTLKQIFWRQFSQNFLWNFCSGKNVKNKLSPDDDKKKKN